MLESNDRDQNCPSVFFSNLKIGLYQKEDDNLWVQIKFEELDHLIKNAGVLRLFSSYDNGKRFASPSYTAGNYVYGFESCWYNNGAYYITYEEVGSDEYLIRERVESISRFRLRFEIQLMQITKKGECWLWEKLKYWVVNFGKVKK